MSTENTDDTTTANAADEGETSPADATTNDESPAVEDAGVEDASSDARNTTDGDPASQADEDGADATADEEPVAEIIDPAVLLLQHELSRVQKNLETEKREKAELTERLRLVSDAYRKNKDDVAATRSRLERLAKEKEEIRRGEVVSSLFEPLQNLRRAREGMHKAAIGDGHIQGVDMVIKQILTAFENLGMEEVPGKGSVFDPNVHEALTMIPVQDPALHESVMEVFEAGYRIGKRLIRPARVVVGQYTAPPQPDPPAQDEDTADSDTAAATEDASAMEE